MRSVLTPCPPCPPLPPGEGERNSRCSSPSPERSGGQGVRTSRRHSHAKRRVHLADLRGLGARIEPFPAPHLERAERRREESVRPVDLARDEIIGASPIAGRRAP